MIRPPLLFRLLGADFDSVYWVCVAIASLSVFVGFLRYHDGLSDLWSENQQRRQDRYVDQASPFHVPLQLFIGKGLVRTSTVVLKRRDGDMIRLETRGPQEVSLGSASSANEDK